jgi:hypothetical protein
MTWSWNRVLSGLLAVFYIIGASAMGGAEDGFKAFACVILPLACIWFGDAMGSYTGPSGSIWINVPTPGAIVRILGWILLLLPLVFIIL